MDKKEAEMKQQIAMMMTKKDYYDILGITKTATDTEIKKSYKKLALRFHPDKNQTQGAKEVFKKVSNAYTVLINPQQRERYDRFGPEEEQQMRFRQQRAHQQQYDDFDEFDEIFRQFFGMGHMHRQAAPRYRTYTFNMGGAHPQGQQNRNQGFGLGYFFIMIFIFYVISPLLKTQPYFSFTPSSDYRFKVTSDVLKTNYYVREEFFQEARKNVQFKPKIDTEVDQIHMVNLKKSCDQAERMKKRFEYQAYQYSAGSYRNHYLHEAKKVDMSSCREFQKFYERNPEYVSQMFYYR